MNENEQALATQPTSTPALLTHTGFELAQRMASALAKSTLIPQNFQNNLPNCLIALEMANRMGASPMMVMQNLYIVHGKPAWSSQFVIAAINSTGRFSPLRFDVSGDGDKKQCIAWAVELGTKERLEGPPVSIAMAKAEGWHGKNGSKWQTMPELMLRYRAATFFGRLYAPEVLMGMREESEVIDVDTTPAIPRPIIGSAVSESEKEQKPTKRLKPIKGKKANVAALEIESRLKAAGASTLDLLRVAIQKEWIDPPDADLNTVELSSIDEEKLNAILDVWPDVAEAIDNRKSNKTGSELPFA